MSTTHIEKSVVLGDVKVSNSIAMAPLTRGRATEAHLPTDIMVDYYRQRANAGLIISEGVGISPQGMGWAHAPGIYTEEQVEAWKPVTEAVHDAGGKIALQLWHLGRQCHSDVTGQPIVAPSAIALPMEVTANNHEKKPAEVPHELTEEEIAQVVEDYGVAAENAIKAGFDMVEIHGANGYLVDEFIQSSTNTRTDKYGGSMENRLRFLQEVVDRVIEGVSADKVGIRFSPNGVFGGMGSADNNETFTEALRMMAERKIAYVHVMDGLGFGFHKLSEPFTLEMVRKIVGDNTKIIGNVGYTKETAEEMLASGNADMIAFGRPYISNPDLFDRFVNGYELAEDAKYEDWWGTTTSKGYTDFPAYSKSKEN